MVNVFCTDGNQKSWKFDGVGERSDCVEKYWHMIKNKKSGSIILKVKSDAWDEIARQYNSISSTKRTVQQLKQVLLKSIRFIFMKCVLSIITYY